MIPTRTKSQRMEALQLANQERSHKAKVKKQLNAGEVEPLDVLDDPPLSMTVYEFLTAMHYIGDLRAREIAGAAHLRLDKRLSTMSERQRSDLAESLDRGYWKAGQFCDCGNRLHFYNQSGVCKSCITEHSAERRATVIDLHKQGFTPSDIGEEVGLEPKSVSEILRVAA